MRGRRAARFAAGLVACALLAAGAAGGWLWWRLNEPYRGYAGAEAAVIVPPGSDAGAILERLEEAGVVWDARLARAYLVHHLGDPHLKAGEYAFRQPLSTPEVLGKLIRGEVVTHGVTVIEGLTLDEIAEHLAGAGFGRREAFLAAMRSPEPILDLDPAARDLEGYLFPDTYHFARGTAEETIVEEMVRTFRRRWRAGVAPLLEPGRGTREVVILASVVEKEARREEERPLIAGVYANRLRRGMGLYADPTVIYALKRLGRWDGNLRRPDLRLDSPYNTYRYQGLPPGPICSPGLASLRSAAAPADVPYLYFVSRNDGSHVFAESLAEHNRNVARWQKRYWRERWAAEGRNGSD